MTQGHEERVGARKTGMGTRELTRRLSETNLGWVSRQLVHSTYMICTHKERLQSSRRPTSE
jgi:hypothetical protein